MSSIGWPAIEKALRAWCVAGTGLAAVIWGYQTGPRPQPPYVALSIVDTVGVGRDWKDRGGDPDPTLGQRRLHRGHRVATLTVQCFAEVATGVTGAMARLTDAVAALEIHADALNTAGCGIGKTDRVRLVAGRINTQLEPRAVTEVELHLLSELESYAQYVDRVQVTTTLDDGAIEVEQWIPDPPA